MFILALFTIDKLEIIQMLNSILMDKLCYVHLYNGVLLSNKKGQVTQMCNSMDEF